MFIETLRNAYAQTAVAPYAVRPKEKAPIATPIPWEEVRDSKLTSQRYNLKNINKYLEDTGDLWHGMNTYARGIKTARKKLT